MSGQVAVPILNHKAHSGYALRHSTSKRGKKRLNLRWFGPIHKYFLDAEHKTSIYIIMEFVKESLQLPSGMFKEINDEYYGWVE